LNGGEGLPVALAEAGLPAADAARASYVLQVHVPGSIARDCADRDPAPGASAQQGDDASRQAERRAALSALPADDLPRMAAVLDVIAGHGCDDQFVWGIARVLDGLVPPVGAADTGQDSDAAGSAGPAGGTRMA